jgi:hypothetical protein
MASTFFFFFGFFFGNFFFKNSLNINNNNFGVLTSNNLFNLIRKEKND